MAMIIRLKMCFKWITEKKTKKILFPTRKLKSNPSFIFVLKSRQGIDLSLIIDFFPKKFVTLKFWPLNISIKILFGPKFCLSETFFDLKIFWIHNFFDPKFLLTQRFFWTWNFNEPKFLDRKYWELTFLWILIVFDPQIFGLFYR